jgi:hypothetical protein
MTSPGSAPLTPKSNAEYRPNSGVYFALRTSALLLVVTHVAWLLAASLPDSIIPRLLGQVVDVEELPVETRAAGQDKITSDYRVQNISGTPIRILGVDLPCHCVTTASLFPIDVGPGDATILTFEAEPDRDNPGVKVHYAKLLISGSHGAAPILKIRLHAN